MTDPRDWPSVVVFQGEELFHGTAQECARFIACRQPYPGCTNLDDALRIGHNMAQPIPKVPA